MPSSSPSPSSSSPAPSPTQPPGALEALQSALAAEHAAVYGYGVVGARLASKRRERAKAAYDAHRARRNALERAVRDLGGAPAAAAAAYTLPFPVGDAEAAVELAVYLEDRVASVYADVVRDVRGDLRRDAAEALRDAAVRAVGWRGRGVAFPGLPERAPTSSASASATPAVHRSSAGPGGDGPAARGSAARRPGGGGAAPEGAPDGARPDGARADGAGTDEARADAARVDGAGTGGARGRGRYAAGAGGGRASGAAAHGTV